MDDFTKKKLSDEEGFSSRVYDDTKGIPTVGYGTNLNSPEVSDLAQQVGINLEAVRSGKEELTEEQAAKLRDAQLDEKRQFFDRVQARDFPNADIQPHERSVLDRMIYQSPKYLGPNMRKYLQENDDAAVTKEILLRSNKDKVPGIQRRRLEQAREYAGENFNNIIDTLTPEELQEIKDILGKIKNINTKKQIIKENPFLKDLIPSPRFNKLRGK